MSRAVRLEPLPYLPHVDGLRALAVALVVIYHAWPSALPGGFIGVDVFFVISGFIITRQLAAEMETGTFSYSVFLGRRVRRLVPAAIVCCLLVSAVAVVVLMPEALTSYSESLAAVWTMVANFYFYLHSGYFDAPSAEAPLLHMWSLAVEDQFYLTWPLLLLLLFRRLGTRPRIVAASLALGGVSLVHSAISAHSDPNLAFYLPFSRAFELLAGCALALGLRLLPNLSTSVRALLDGAGLALVGGSAILLQAGTPFPGLAALPAVAGSVLLIGAGLSGATPVSRLLALKPAVLTGRMSYSIYLYHWPVLAFAAYQLGRAPDAGEAAVLVLAGVALGALSWALVEQALTRRLGLYELPPSALFKRLVVAGTTLCLLAAVGALTRGLPQRLDAPAYDVYRAASAGNPLRPACDGHDLAFRNTSHCTFGRPLAERASYDIAVFGDSNADHFVPMIAELAAQTGLSGRQVTQSSCGALIGASRKRSTGLEQSCTLYQETILKFLDRNPNLKIAVLASVWSNYASAQTNSVSEEGIGHERSLAHFARTTIDIFRKRGIKVLVIGQIPYFETFSLRCFADAARRDTEETDCTMPRSAVDYNLAQSQTAFQAIDEADPDVMFLDMEQLLCTQSFCSAFKDEVLLYRDRGHLNALGSAYLARYASLPKIDER